MERPWNGWSTLQMNSTALADSAVEVADILFLHSICGCPHMACAVRKRRFPVGANPTR
jgi:hypothetical protein